MTKFVCDNCQQEFARNENLVYHKEHDSCKEKDFACDSCGKKFTSKQSMQRHVRTTCLVKKNQDAERELILERLVKVENEHKTIIQENKTKFKTMSKEIKQLKTTNEKLVKKLKVVENKTINNNTINNNTINNNVNNGINNVNNGIVINHISLVGYGKEDLSKLDKSELIKILHQGFFSTLKLTEAVHFNPKYPEYHNIYISNMKDKYAMMFDGKNWTLITKEELINQIYEDKKNYIEENLEEFVKSLPVSRKNALERWLETDDENAKIKEIKNSIKLLLYNSRKMVTNTIDKISEDSKSKSIKSIKMIKNE